MTTRKINTMYPDTGPYRRELYTKHMLFFELGAKYRQRLLMAANRSGKTIAGAFEMSCHLTGDYPKWWPGMRMGKRIRCIAAGDTRETVRDILAVTLLGPPGERGTGMIPGDRIHQIDTQPGIKDGVAGVYVYNRHGGTSYLGFKTYDQGRKSFQGTAQDIVWFDEEPPKDCYDEGLTRLATTGGSMIMTFTPLNGYSDVVKSFLPSGEFEESRDSKTSKAVVFATWDDVPHLDEATKEMLFSSYLPYQRDARSKGVPSLGAGAIYPIGEQEILVDDFEIPAHWPRAYALDVGWNRTAAVWGAWNLEEGVLYLYSEYYSAQEVPIVHAEAIKARGSWIRGVVDPSARGRGSDGFALMSKYSEMGLELDTAVNAVEAGLYEVWQGLMCGRIKVFKSLRNLMQEFRLYRRDERGRIVKENDHLMDAMRYLVMSGADVRGVMKRDTHNRTEFQTYYDTGRNNNSWMGN